MQTTCHPIVLPLLALSLAAAIGAAPAVQETPEPDRVEEDWEVVIDVPDPDLSGPQITTTMRPEAGGAAAVRFILNNRDYPDFEPGGLQVQAWSGDRVVEAASHGTALCRTNGETITWTQRLSRSGEGLRYEVLSGTSSTWGEFGQPGQLAVDVPGSVASLAAYRPDDTMADSGVGFQSNRVTQMTLLRVRYYQGETLLSTDESPRPVRLSN